MGRRAKGWTLFRRGGDGPFHIRFRHDGRRYHFSTRESDPRAAENEAKRLYTEAVSGQVSARSPAETSPARTHRPLDELFAEWLAAVESSLDETTAAQYEMYVGTHFVPFFRSLDRITDAGGVDYWRHRLRCVRRKTVLKELSALRGFLAWCKAEKHIDSVPVIASPKKQVVGTRDTRKRHKAEPIPLDEAEVAAVLQRLPERERGLHPRAYFTALWETALRPGTVQALRAPEDYARGRSTLRIRDEADKARFGREVDLTPAARVALDARVPDVGLIFGKHDHRTVLRRAAREAGLPAEKAARLSDYDFRHARLTFLAEHSQNLPGVAYLAGHKHVSTTSRYVHPARRAAREVLAAVGAEFGTRSAEFGTRPGPLGSFDP